MKTPLDLLYCNSETSFLIYSVVSGTPVSLGRVLWAEIAINLRAVTYPHCASNVNWPFIMKDYLVMLRARSRHIEMLNFADLLIWILSHVLQELMSCLPSITVTVRTALSFPQTPCGSLGLLWLIGECTEAVQRMYTENVLTAVAPLLPCPFYSTIILPSGPAVTWDYEDTLKPQWWWKIPSLAFWWPELSLRFGFPTAATF